MQTKIDKMQRESTAPIHVKEVATAAEAEAMHAMLAHDNYDGCCNGVFQGNDGPVYVFSYRCFDEEV